MHFFKSIVNCLGNLCRSPRAEFARSPGTSQAASAGETKGKTARRNDNLIDRYDFGAQINALQDTNSLQRGAQTVNPKSGFYARLTRRAASPQFRPGSSRRPTCSSRKRRRRPSR